VPDEASLLERARRQDQVALGEIYDLYARKIYAYLYHRLGDRSLAEDLTAEVFLKMLEAAHSAHFARVSLAAWLYRIAHNLVVDYLRRQPQRETLSLHEDMGLVAGDAAAEVDKKLRQDRLRAALQHLTEEQQQVVFLRFGEGLSAPQVAEVLGKTEGAVRALQHRALDTLRHILEGETA